MLSSITPLGERGRRNSYLRAVTAHLLGTVAGGAAAGVTFSLLGAALASALGDGYWRVAVAAAFVAVTVAGDSTGRVPSTGRQVDEGWLTSYRDWVYGLGYGFQLGAGELTVVTTWLVHLTWVLALLTADPLAGLTVGIVFGGIRGLSVALAAGVRNPEDLRDLFERLVGRREAARVATLGGEWALVCGAAALAVAAW